MALGDITRINTNIAALNALNSLKNIGSQLAATQLRIQTSKRINSAADDPAGFAIASKFDVRARGLATALDSVGNFNNVLGIAEGGMQSIHDTLLNIRDLVTKAASDDLGSQERTAIKSQITDLSAEITRLQGQTTFNGVKLLDGSFTSKRVQTGSEGTDNLSVGISQDFSLASLGVVDASINVSTSALASTSLGSLDAAISTVRTQIQGVGSLVSRLQSVQDSLSVAITNTKAAKSRILDADVAAEQVNSVRLQILQQLATSQLAQANTGPQSLLALFR
jgi:flagellin